ncbi:hypothetical protein NDU88_004308 [Pleurodeles waltl]|uniref:Uncharacterized protein n=1 Tax=Pleurodeles waltl TaxID=8319 RepID=A0AAV7N2M8_PLEWA|nr:hypothetical protein NDU88_004308 [Pleurodeles waltl]
MQPGLRSYQPPSAMLHVVSPAACVNLPAMLHASVDFSRKASCALIFRCISELRRSFPRTAGEWARCSKGLRLANGQNRNLRQCKIGNVMQKAHFRLAKSDGTRLRVASVATPFCDPQIAGRNLRVANLMQLQFANCD